MMFVPDSQQIHSPSSFGSWFLCPDIYWASHELHWMNFRDVCSRETWPGSNYLWQRVLVSLHVKCQVVRSGERSRAKAAKVQRWLLWCFIYDEGGNIQRMMTVLEAFLWWGWLGYWLRTSSVPSCFHLTVKQDKRGLNFYDSTLARPTVSITSDAQTLFWQREWIQSAFSRQPLVITVLLTQTLVGSF